MATDFCLGQVFNPSSGPFPHCHLPFLKLTPLAPGTLVETGHPSQALHHPAPKCWFASSLSYWLFLSYPSPACGFRCYLPASYLCKCHPLLSPLILSTPFQLHEAAWMSYTSHSEPQLPIQVCSSSSSITELHQWHYQSFSPQKQSPTIPTPLCPNQYIIPDQSRGNVHSPSSCPSPGLLHWSCLFCLENHNNSQATWSPCFQSWSLL